MEDDLNALIDYIGCRAEFVVGHLSLDGFVRGAESGNESSSGFYAFPPMSTKDFEDLIYFNGFSVTWVHLKD